MRRAAGYLLLWLCGCLLSFGGATFVVLVAKLCGFGAGPLWVPVLAFSGVAAVWGYRLKVLLDKPLEEVLGLKGKRIVIVDEDE